MHFQTFLALLFISHQFFFIFFFVQEVDGELRAGQDRVDGLRNQGDTPDGVGAGVGELSERYDQMCEDSTETEKQMKNLKDFMDKLDEFEK